MAVALHVVGKLELLARSVALLRGTAGIVFANNRNLQGRIMHYADKFSGVSQRPPFRMKLYESGVDSLSKVSGTLTIIKHRTYHYFD